ncbi:hypothetical protein E0Z10_g4763 [Xylaria hypoxylon]|uniref:BZIP domain-containing protein n=1 Tax=Xylaria hypoxylon TaxID=37992 RepID=A0A4Z0YVR9_9PEZI|nr:hypothetical protein E0Z10_g4763 [Xylaria hypoxylon]
MMTGRVYVDQRLEDNTCDLNLPLYCALSESEESPTLELSWAHPARDMRYGPGQNMRSPARETWADSADLEPYIPTDINFNSRFELDSDLEGSASFAQGRMDERSTGDLTPLNTAGFISDQQNFGAEAVPDGNEAYEATSNGPSPVSTVSPSKSATTPKDSIGASEVHRERNRVAARKCRQKAKHNFTGLQRREKELNRQNKLLHNHVGGLRDEILDLKNEILQHSDCNSSVIQNYIANAARRQLG